MPKVYKTIDEIMDAMTKSGEAGLKPEQASLAVIMAVLIDIRDLLIEIKENTDVS
jgi:hypothetical protein